MSSQCAIGMAWLHLVLLATLCKRISPVQVNIALHQATFQSSARYDGVSSRAVDGNRDSAWGGNSCTHTFNEANPWWAVDLESHALTLTLNITNRIGGASERFKQIRIGTTATSPTDAAPSLEALAVCATRDEQVGPGETVTFPCEAVHRYLVVMLEGAEHTLTLCEVEVFEDRSAYKFVGAPKCRQNLQPVSRAEQQQRLTCLSECAGDPFCKAVNLTTCATVQVGFTDGMDLVKDFGRA